MGGLRLGNTTRARSIAGVPCSIAKFAFFQSGSSCDLPEWAETTAAGGLGLHTAWLAAVNAKDASSVHKLLLLSPVSFWRRWAEFALDGAFLVLVQARCTVAASP